MPRRGAITVTPNPAGADDGTNKPWTTAKWNANGQPTAQVGEHEIGTEELVQADVQDVVGAMLAGKAIVSPDYVQGRFYDGVLTVGSTNFTSTTMALGNADTGRAIIATGIPNGSTIAYTNPNTGILSQAAIQIFADGVISGGTNLYSPTGNFSPADNGRTVVDTSGAGLIPAGTTLTYVNAQNATLSQAGTNGAVSFQVNGRQITGVTFQIVGRGVGFKIAVNANGVATFEDYTGFFGGLMAVANTAILSDGTIICGVGANKLVISPNGDALWASGGLGITHDGKLFSGAATFSDAILKLAASGDFTLQDLATSNHQIDSGALNPFVKALVASPAGGAIGNPTNVALNCLTKYSRIYYRLNALDGVSTNASKTFTSATLNAKPTDVGKGFNCAGYAAGAYIEKWTSATSIDISVAASASATGLDYQITPDRTDTLYVDGTPLSLTATRRLTGRGFKNGEYSALLSLLFTLDATTVPNPEADPDPDTYGGRSLVVTLLDGLAGSTVWWTIGNNAGSVPADPDGTQNVIAPVGGNPPSGNTTLGVGTWVIKAKAIKAGLTGSAIIQFTYVVTKGGFPA